MPDATWGEFHLSTPVGVPLEEMIRIPGTVVPKNGSLIPSDAPGFGLEIQEDGINPWTHGTSSTGNDEVVL